ncbi:MAG: Rpn family recombination-promoting nuclease/putative transposase, partial [Deltaproteobacteria bacterium]|nr:Rpn family recombination-promoting nuclease/putative transposase [Deltaproteobacteria bacterium]
DGAMAFIYFLVEHQSEPHALMAFRLLTYIQRIWATILREDPKRKTLPIVVPIVVHHGRGGWTEPRTLHELVDGLDDMPELGSVVPNFEMIIDDLVRVDDPTLLARPLEAFPKVALWVLRDARTIEALLESLGAWREEIEQLVAPGRDSADFDTLVRYIIRVAKDVSFETIRDRFIEVIPEVEAAMASPAEQLIEKGRQEGEARGMEKGRQEANRTMLARLLQLRFGALGSAVEARIAEGNLEELEEWLDRVITAETLDGIFAD